MNQSQTYPRPPGDRIFDLGQLRRSVDDSYVAGVSGGLGRHFDIDPVIIRVLFAVGCLFGGSGVLLYVAAWILVPVEGRDRAVVRVRPQTRSVILVIIAAVTALSFLWAGWMPGWMVMLGILAGIAVYGFESRRSSRIPAAPPPGMPSYARNADPTPAASAAGPTPAFAAPVSTLSTPAPTAPTGPGASGPDTATDPADGLEHTAPLTGAGSIPAGPSGTIPGPLTSDTAVLPQQSPPAVGGAAGTGGTGSGTGGGFERPGWIPAYTPPTRPKKSGPVLFWPTLALIVIALGTLGVIDATGTSVDQAAYPALALAVVGAMLVVGAFFGRAGGLILLGLLSTFALAVSSVVGQWNGGTQRDIAPLSASSVASSYSMTNGETVIDLTQVKDPKNLDGRTVRFRGNLGRVQVLLPRGVAAQLDATLGLAGEIDAGGIQQGGFQTAAQGPVGTGASTLNLDLHLRAGQIEVTPWN